jgi:hypothetical protein
LTGERRRKRPRRSLVALAAVAAALVAVGVGVTVTHRSGSPTTAPAPAGSPHVRRAVPPDQLPAWLWGVTLDDVSQPAPIVASLGALPTKPIARVVFDQGTSPADYAGAITALHPHSYLMGELVDSSDATAYTVAAYRQKAVDFVNAFGDQVDLWEIGNEVNGEWLGPTSQTVAKITAAYQVVTAAGGRTALTLYYNPNCWSKASNEMFTWAQANIPAAIKAGLDYVFISYYPEDCNNYWPSQAGWQSVFDQLHRIFPTARLGFGESGNSNDRDTVAEKVALLHRYYQLQIHGDRYVGGYFWWYYVEDALPHRGNPIWQTLAAYMARPPAS